MNTKIITAIVLKLFAIYVLISIITSLGAVYGLYLNIENSNVGPANILSPIIMIALTIIIGLILVTVLWKLGNNVIEQLPKESNEHVISNIGQLEPILMRFLGVYIFVTTIVELPTVAANLWFRTYSQQPELDINDYAWLISIGFQLAIGILLIVKTSIFVNLFKKNEIE